MRSIDQSRQFFIDNNFRTQLNEIYAKVPHGSCIGSARCCCESVNCFYSEYIAVVEELRRNGTFELFEPRAVAYWLREFSVSMNCPLLKDDGLCEVYPVRPLPCRVFGHLNRSDFEENTRLIHLQNKDAADELFSEYGIRVPDSILNGQVGYCENFCSNNPMSADDRDDLIDMLFSVESTFLMNEMLEGDEFNFSLTQWFAYERFGREKAIELRISIAQEFSKQGRSPLFESLFPELT